MTELSESRDGWVNALAAALFARPSRLVTTLTHRVDGRFVIAPHRHEEVLQFDVLRGCAGRAKVGLEWTELSGMTVMMVPPRTEHGYRLEPEADGGAGRVYHARVDVSGLDFPGAGIPGKLSGKLPGAGLLTGLASHEPLLSAMRVVVRLGAVEEARPPMLLARLVEAMCLWPDEEGHESSPPDDHAEDEQRGLDAAVNLIEARLHDPPNLDELAKVAHFSTRHFARRFQKAFGCTPHTYLNARRLAVARQLLSQERLSIGQIAGELGFGSVATFSRWFSQQAGMSPTACRENPELM